MTAYREREISSLVRQALKTLPVVVVTGLRQVGKTTFLRGDKALRERRYLTLDDLPTLEAAQRDPDAAAARSASRSRLRAGSAIAIWPVSKPSSPPLLEPAPACSPTTAPRRSPSARISTPSP